MVIVHLDASSTTSSSSQHQQQQQQGPQHQQQQQGPQHQQQQAGEASSLAAAVDVLAWLDRTLRYLNNSNAFKDTVLLAVLATPGAAGALPAAVPLLQGAGDCPVSSMSQSAAQQLVNDNQQQQQQQVQESPAGAASHTAGLLQPAGRPVLRPLQSWQQLGGAEIAVDVRRPLLCLRRLPGVIRRDSCNRFSLAECCSSTGVLGLLADRLIPEIAYKLGRAPKYGA
jgi:hypothetical protein